MNGTRLQQAMSARGMNPTELAEKADITTQTVSHYVRGQRCKYMECFKNVCVALNVSADYLLGLSDEMERGGARMGVEE